ATLAVVGHVFLDDRGVRIVQHHHAACRTNELRMPLDHAMTFALGLGFDFARPSHFEALFRTALSLQFGHFAGPFPHGVRSGALDVYTTQSVLSPVTERLGR